MNCGLVHRLGPDPVWLWHRWVATAPTRHLAWEPPYAMDENLKKKKKKKERKKTHTKKSMYILGMYIYIIKDMPICSFLLEFQLYKYFIVY